MKSLQIQYWKQVAVDLGIDIVAPFELTFPDGTPMVANALVRDFGAALGMVADDEWGAHAESLIALGYGFSCVSLGPSKNYRCESFFEMLADWNWSGCPSQRPSWLPTNAAHSNADG